MKPRYWILIAFLLAVVITYFTGPKIPQPTYATDLPDLPDDLVALQEYVQEREAQLPVRADNQARILWHAGVERTEYSIVYLHGFAGSYRDGYPVNMQIADSLGANLYLARWAGHGLKPPASLDKFSPDAAWASAKEALVIGRTTGRKVIILSTSTGGTLAVKLAATYPDQVHALINLSPNIEDDPDVSFILNSPWGYEIAQLVAFGDQKKIKHEKEIATQYWDTIYPSSSLVDLQVLVNTIAKEETFRKVECPVLTLYYHRNFIEEDEHVDVEIYPEMHAAFSTPDSLEKLKALEAPETHFIGSEIYSKNTEVVVEEIMDFLRNVLEIPRE